MIPGYFMTIFVVAVVEPPYVMRAPDGSATGIAVDILKNITAYPLTARMMGTTVDSIVYNFTLLDEANVNGYSQADQYGDIVGGAESLLDTGEANLAITLHHMGLPSLYWFEYSIPFASVGQAVLAKIGSESKTVDMWNFTSPFEPTVWFAILGFVVGTGMLSWWVDRVSRKSFGKLGRNTFVPAWLRSHAYERRKKIHQNASISSLQRMDIPTPVETWRTKTKCLSETNSISQHWYASRLRQFNDVAKSFGALHYYVMQTLLGKDTPETPRSWSGRTMFLAQFFFMLFIMSAYDSSLNAQQVASSFSGGIRSFEELVQSNLPFGVVADSEADMFFRDSPLPLYRRLANIAIAYPTMADAVKGLRKGEIPAIIGNQAVLEWYASHPPCDLKMVGGAITVEFAGFAMSKYPYGWEGWRINKGVKEGAIRAQADGLFERVKQDYLNTIPNRCRYIDLASTPPADSNTGQSFMNFAGIFVVMLGCFVVGLFWLQVEKMLWALRKYKCCRRLNQMQGWYHPEVREALKRKYQHHEFLQVDQ